MNKRYVLANVRAHEGHARKILGTVTTLQVYDVAIHAR